MPSASLCCWPRRSSRSSLPGELGPRVLCRRWLLIAGTLLGKWHPAFSPFSPGSSRPCPSLPPPLARLKEVEEKLAAAESSRDQLEQQLAVARSQLADTRALMDSTQVCAGKV